jgi:xylulokinase
MSLIGLDIGTSAVKGVLLDGTGHVRSQVRHGYRVRSANPDRAELSAHRVWAATRWVIRRLAIVARPVDPVRALCVGGSGDEVVLLDERDRPVAPVILALDRRAAAVGVALAERFGTAWLRERTGLHDAGATPLARLLWLREHDPQTATRIRRVLAWPEFIAHRLGVAVGSEPTLAARTLGYAIADDRFEPAILGPLGVDASLFAPLVGTGDVLGTMAPAVAEDMGLPIGVNVVAGGFDQAMATLGAGVVGVGVAHLGAGSWEALTVLLPKRSAGRELLSRGWSTGRSIGAHLPWSAMTSAPGGLAVQWFADLIADGSSGHRPGVARLMSEAAGGPGGALALAGSDELTTWSLAGLDLSTRRGEMLAAVLESTAWRLAHALQQAEAVGVRVATLRASGGGARSAAWLQLKADVTGRVVERTAIEEVGAFAAGLLAGAATGAFPAPSTAAPMLVRMRDSFEPRPDRTAWHAERADRARRAAAALELTVDD